MARVRYNVLTEGFIPATAKLIKTAEGSTEAVVVAEGTPNQLRDIAAKLNAYEAAQPAPEKEDPANG